MFTKKSIHKQHYIYTTTLEYASMRLMVPDTILTIDSTVINGLMQYDTTSTFEEDQRSMSRSSYAYPLLDKHLRNIEGVDKYTFYAPGSR